MSCRLRECVHHKDTGPCPVHPKTFDIPALMEPGQEEHLVSIISSFLTQVNAKYRKGQAEHGGNLYDLPILTLIDNAMEEAVDQYTYLKTLRDKIVGSMQDIAAEVANPNSGQ